MKLFPFIFLPRLNEPTNLPANSNTTPAKQLYASTLDGGIMADDYPERERGIVHDWWISERVHAHEPSLFLTRSRFRSQKTLTAFT